MRQTFAVIMTALLALSLFAPAVAAGAGTATADATNAECEYPIELTDATGETITLDEPPESVVALQASDAQTVFEIGAEDRLVGMPVGETTDGLDHGETESVGDGWNVDHETVIDLDPDIVLAANATFESDIETLRDAGLTVYHFDEAETIDDVRDNVVRTGELTGECGGADETVDWMDEQLEIIELALEDVDRPLAYYSMGQDGFTAGPGTFVHEVLTTGGVENLAEDDGYYEMNVETVVDEDPDWIIHPGEADETVPELLEATTAYQNDNVVSVESNQISQPAPQIIYAVVDVIEAVHPDAYAEASAELDAAEDDADDDEADDSDDDTVPGFGIPVAIAAALAAVGLLARRR